MDGHLNNLMFEVIVDICLLFMDYKRVIKMLNSADTPSSYEEDLDEAILRPQAYYTLYSIIIPTWSKMEGVFMFCLTRGMRNFWFFTLHAGFFERKKKKRAHDFDFLANN